MKALKLCQAFALLFLLSACEKSDTCKIGEEADCPPEAFCYAGEGGAAGTHGVCVFGELSSAGKPVPKIKAWRLLLSNATEIQPLRWDEGDGKENRENANAGWVGMQGAVVEVEVAGLATDKLEVWAGHAHADCKPPGERKPEGELWACHFKGGWASAQPTSETVEIKLQAGEAALRTRTYRVLCSHNLEGLAGNEVSVPLAMSGKRLLFGSDSPVSSSGLGNAAAPSSPLMPTPPGLYVFDTTTCALVGSLHTDAVQGPMVALSDTGDVAVATNGEEGGRLSVVNVFGAEPHFTANNVCVEGEAFFKHGLSLLSLLPWRLVAPANHKSRIEANLVAYAPEAAGLEVCKSSNTVSRHFETPISQYADGMLIEVYNNTLSEPPETRSVLWPSNDWLPEGDASKGIPMDPNNHIERISPVALGDGYSFFSKNLLSESAAAVDSRGRPYFARNALGGNVYHMHRGEPCNDNEFEGAPVGSPLLGEPVPGGEAEIYVVTTAGWVLAYGVELGEPLWTYDLGVGIDSRAQPVLSGDTLWVVGRRGEIRGIRVNSNGLNRKAFWPKLFRDNCNTSSQLSTPTSLPNCF